MLSLLPDYYVSRITEIKSELLNRHKLIVADADNTLVYAETATSLPEIAAWGQQVAISHRLVCVSNSRTIAERSENLTKLFSCDVFVGSSRKPSSRLFRQLIEKYDVLPQEVLIIGDRLFTDILWGNRGGATTVLVEPLGEDRPWVRAVRPLERFLLFLFHQSPAR